MLLHGEKNSGKTTIIKQLNYWNYGVLFDDYKEVIKEINSIAKDAVLYIVSKMSQQDLPVEKTDPDTQYHVEYIQAHIDHWSTLSTDFFEHAKALWQDDGVKEWFMQSPEYGSMSFAKYFLDRLDIIKQADYVPTVQDYFWCKSKFASRPDPHFMIHEWRTSRNRRYVGYLAECVIDMCIVIIDCSIFNEYDVFQEKSKLENQLLVLKFIHSLISRPSRDRAQSVPFLIFLNKQDQLAAKLRSGRWKLEDSFPDFVHYTIPQDACSSSDDELIVTRAKYFIRDLVQNSLKEIFIEEPYLSIHFTTATNRDTMKQVFLSCESFLKLHNILK